MSSSSSRRPAPLQGLVVRRPQPICLPSPSNVGRVELPGSSNQAGEVVSAAAGPVAQQSNWEVILNDPHRNTVVVYDRSQHYLTVFRRAGASSRRFRAQAVSRKKCPFCHQHIPDTAPRAGEPPQMSQNYFELLDRVHELEAEQERLEEEEEEEEEASACLSASPVGEGRRGGLTRGRRARRISDASGVDAEQHRRRSRSAHSVSRASAGDSGGGSNTRPASRNGRQISAEDSRESNTASMQSPKGTGLSQYSFNDGYYDRFFDEERCVGHGTFGGVYLCHHKLDDVILGSYAIKKIPVGDSRDWLVQTLKEVHALEHMHHPHIVDYKHAWLEHHQLADFGPAVPCLFVLMEYADLGSLADIIWPKELSEEDRLHREWERAKRKRERVKRAKMKHKKKETRTSKRTCKGGGGLNADDGDGGDGDDDDDGTDDGDAHDDGGEEEEADEDDGGPRYLSELDVIKYFTDTCLGLQSLHHSGIVHRDLKPDNLLLTTDPGSPTSSRVLISDFGQSVFLGTHTFRSGNTGTLLYCAPEVLSDDPAYVYNYAADIWSLGVILYALAFSSHPFVAGSPEALIDQIRNKPLRFPSEPKRSPKMLHLLDELLARAPEDRPTIDEVLLHPLLGTSAMRTPQSSHPSPAAKPSSAAEKALGLFALPPALMASTDATAVTAATTTPASFAVGSEIRRDGGLSSDGHGASGQGAQRVATTPRRSLPLGLPAPEWAKDAISPGPPDEVAPGKRRGSREDKRSRSRSGPRAGDAVSDEDDGHVESALQLHSHRIGAASGHELHLAEHELVQLHRSMGAVKVASNLSTFLHGLALLLQVWSVLNVCEGHVALSYAYPHLCFMVLAAYSSVTLVTDMLLPAAPGQPPRDWSRRDMARAVLARLIVPGLSFLYTFAHIVGMFSLHAPSVCASSAPPLEEGSKLLLLFVAISTLTLQAIGVASPALARAWLGDDQSSMAPRGKHSHDDDRNRNRNRNHGHGHGHDCDSDCDHRSNGTKPRATTTTRRASKPTKAVLRRRRRLVLE